MEVIIAILLLCLVLAIEPARAILFGLIVLAAWLVRIALAVVLFLAGLLVLVGGGAGLAYYVAVESGATDATAGWTAAAAAVAITVWIYAELRDGWRDD